MDNFKTKNGFIYSTIQFENIHFPFAFLFCLFFLHPPFAHMDTSLRRVISRAELETDQNAEWGFACS